ncbi:MAG: YhdH/YhfP family quinone oxidoreductase [Desulfobacterales bacterium]
MSTTDFKAMVVEEKDPHTFTRRIARKSIAELPDGDVLIKVSYSSLNYKDALSATGNPGVTRKFPHTPGIDAAGSVAQSSAPQFNPGQDVIVTGYDLGMNTSGGFAEYIRVPSDWVVPRPEALSPMESMIYGTAGFTAALSIVKLIDHGLEAHQGDVLVTGATGGVGSLAVSILAKIGFRVVAVSGKTDRTSFLQDLGAADVISREEATDTSGRPLLKGRWAGVIDTVGGDILATALKTTQYGGSISCCGLVASPELKTTVFPFILRNVNLLGIDSVACPMSLRREIWQKLAADWKPERLGELCQTVSLEEVDPLIETILKGRVSGRVVIDLNR